MERIDTAFPVDWLAMVRNDTKKKYLFKRFPTNLEHVKQYLSVSAAPDIHNIYICPWGWKLFLKEAISDLTVEHVPPHQSFTCKIGICCP
jgi:hypothetical protein